MANSDKQPGGDAANGDGVYVSDHAEKPITPPERALIHVYSALGLYQDTIGEQVGRSRYAIRDVLQDSRERVENGEDPLEVYADVVGYAVLVGPDGSDGGEA